jgi:hypothetical protein
MRQITLKTIALLSLLVFGSTFYQSNIIAAPPVESAIVEFADTVRLGGVLLRGEYLIVHDEVRMARGEPCTYIYRGKQADETKLVSAFHCLHVKREMATSFKATISRRSSPYETAEVTEIQFAGSTDGHVVP